MTWYKVGRHGGWTGRVEPLGDDYYVHHPDYPERSPTREKFRATPSEIRRYCEDGHWAVADPDLELDEGL